MLTNKLHVSKYDYIQIVFLKKAERKCVQSQRLLFHCYLPQRFVINTIKFLISCVMSTATEIFFLKLQQSNSMYVIAPHNQSIRPWSASLSTLTM